MSKEPFTLETLLLALGSTDPSVRFRAVQYAGVYPKLEFVEHLVNQFAIETEFFVLDMLTWALIQNDHSLVIEKCLVELNSKNAQARAQSLHTLSKIKDGETWVAITDSLLFDADDLVARTAWRTAEILVPVNERAGLAQKLCKQLGRGEREVQRSLSRVLRDLGIAATEALNVASFSENPAIKEHALATQAMINEDEVRFESSVLEAKRRALIINAPMVDQSLLN